MDTVEIPISVVTVLLSILGTGLLAFASYLWTQIVALRREDEQIRLEIQRRDGETKLLVAQIQERQAQIAHTLSEITQTALREGLHGIRAGASPEGAGGTPR